MLKTFIIQHKKLLIYLMVIQELDLKPFTKKIKKTHEQDLKYQLLKSASKITNSSCTSKSRQ